MSTSTLVIVNAQSRTVPKDYEPQIHMIFEPIDCEAHIVDFQDALDADNLSAALEKTTGFVVVWGGDGTICWALDCLEGRRAVLALPGGTMNLVHKRIHGDLHDWKMLLTDALHGRGTNINLRGGVANERLFFVATLLGRLTRLTETREAVREGDAFKALGTLANSNAFDTEDILNVRDLEDRATGAAIFHSEDDDDAAFDVGIINPDNTAELMATAIEIGLKDWRDAHRVQSTQRNEIEIESDRATVPASIDGEAVELTPPVMIKPSPRTFPVVSIKANA